MKRQPRVRGAVRTQVDGISFASKKEATRYGELKLLEKAGQIAGLELQVRFPIFVNNVLICHYVADFCYWEWVSRGEGQEVLNYVVEDAKGMRTEIYRLKKKLFEATNTTGLKIRET